MTDERFTSLGGYDRRHAVPVIVVVSLQASQIVILAVDDALVISMARATACVVALLVMGACALATAQDIWIGPPPPHTVWTRLGTGWCQDDTKQDIQRHLPALWKTGATETELKILCDKYPTCVAIDLGNNENGHLRFSSKAALDAISEPGWGKWSSGCQDDCVPRIAGDAVGACHVKGTAVLLRA